jgi:hypothetical protein
MVQGDTEVIKRLLREAGRHFVRAGRGDHEIWHVNFAIDGKILSRHTANSVLRQAGLQKQF